MLDGCRLGGVDFGKLALFRWLEHLDGWFEPLDWGANAKESRKLRMCAAFVLSFRDFGPAGLQHIQCDGGDVVGENAPELRPQFGVRNTLPCTIQCRKILLSGGWWGGWRPENFLEVVGYRFVYILIYIYT